MEVKAGHPGFHTYLSRIRDEKKIKKNRIFLFLIHSA